MEDIKKIEILVVIYMLRRSGNLCYVKNKLDINWNQLKVPLTRIRI